MQRIPPAEFDPALKDRLEELWGKPPNLYRALGNPVACRPRRMTFSKACFIG